MYITHITGFFKLTDQASCVAIMKQADVIYPEVKKHVS